VYGLEAVICLKELVETVLSDGVQSINANVLKSPETSRTPATINGRSNPFDFNDEIAEIPVPDAEIITLEISELRQNNTDTAIYVQFSTDGGGTYLSSDYEFTFEQIRADATDKSDNGTSASDIKLGEFSNGSKWRKTPIDIKIADPQLDERTAIMWQGVSFDPFNINRLYGAGGVINDSPVDFIRIYEGAQNPIDNLELRVTISGGETL
jgi:hypothetical protein